MKLRELKLDDVANVTSTTVDDEAFRTAQQIVDDVLNRGESALREYGERFDGLAEHGKLIHTKEDLARAVGSIDDSFRGVLERTAQRIRSFAQAQRDSMEDVEVEIPGGMAGHRWLPLQSAGCYAPGGRYPLPSSVLMTVVPARVAGVRNVWVASPNPNEVTLAAAAIAGADGLLSVGGAQAIAALADGLPSELPKCDVIVGPGNKYVTAAKAIVSRITNIDMLAGPSELVVVAGADANPAFVAADLLAQAEHDIDARPILISNSAALVDQVQKELEKQLGELPTAEVAEQAVQSGGFILIESLEEAIQVCRVIAPEHLSLQGSEFESAAERFTFAGALFIGGNTPEVLGDYGAGPNHVLPTAGSANRNSGLSVMTFMRMQTRLRMRNLAAASELVSDAETLGQMEGLCGHAYSCRLRSMKNSPARNSI